ncbi:MAG: glycoside hydrolase family 3 C-terminal domain-containing protein [Clostridiales bacterium]|jgi:beta-glucosidase|nr:glycoside hydrolase family 3 C-terminal domain-containing protein [Clostridiales bacterium]
MTFLAKDCFEEAAELVARMTVEEAASQLRYDAPAIPRLGIPAYNWWNEALHGVARAGTATVFPQAIALAATFDPGLARRVADAVSTEARAKYNAVGSDAGIYKGLTMWTPNINIFRDPRWGRGQETYGEDPYLTAKMGAAFIHGLQGGGERLKTAACAKHFAAHSGPEELRRGFNADVSAYDLEDTYFYAFEEAARSGVEAFMGAYNRLGGEPCCGSEFLLTKTLRGKWGFAGHVVSDCGAIKDFHAEHGVTETPEESAALALSAGCDLNCGSAYRSLLSALCMGLVSEERIRLAAARLVNTRMKLGILGGGSEYDAISPLECDTEEHRALALSVAEKSAVLLKNDGTLPLDRSRVGTVAVIGPTADSRAVLEGNYSGTASEYVTNLAGIREAAGGARVLFAEGCHLYKPSAQPLGEPGDRLAEAVSAARLADVVVLCLGLDPSLEGEQGDAGGSSADGDKPDLLLPVPQRALAEAVLAVGKPTVLAVNAGSALDVSAYGAGAVVWAWYSGAQGGRALGRLLFGDATPSGRLPVTLYYNRNLPPFTDYSMKGRTYRYMTDEPFYPFGHGLSYTRFEYSDLTFDERARKGRARVTNAGGRGAEEVVQVYIRQGHWRLCGTRRVYIEAGASEWADFCVEEKSLTVVDESGARRPMTGRAELFVGGSQPGYGAGVSLTISP